MVTAQFGGGATETIDQERRRLFEEQRLVRELTDKVAPLQKYGHVQTKAELEAHSKEALNMIGKRLDLVYSKDANPGGGLNVNKDYQEASHNDYVKGLWGAAAQAYRNLGKMEEAYRCACAADPVVLKDIYFGLWEGKPSANQQDIPPKDMMLDPTIGLPGIRGRAELEIPTPVHEVAPMQFQTGKIDAYKIYTEAESSHTTADGHDISDPSYRTVIGANQGGPAQRTEQVTQGAAPKEATSVAHTTDKPDLADPFAPIVIGTNQAGQSFTMDVLRPGEPQTAPSQAVRTGMDARELTLELRRLVTGHKFKDAADKVKALTEFGNEKALGEFLTGMDGQLRWNFCNYAQKALIEAGSLDTATKEDCIARARRIGRALTGIEHSVQGSKGSHLQGRLILARASSATGQIQGYQDAIQTLESSPILYGVENAHLENPILYGVAHAQLAFLLKRRADKENRPLKDNERRSIEGHYREAMANFPDNAKIYSNASVYYEAVNDHEKAQEYIKKAVGLLNKGPADKGLFYTNKERETIETLYKKITGNAAPARNAEKSSVLKENLEVDSLDVEGHGAKLPTWTPYQETIGGGAPLVSQYVAGHSMDENGQPIRPGSAATGTKPKTPAQVGAQPGMTHYFAGRDIDKDGKEIARNEALKATAQKEKPAEARGFEPFTYYAGAQLKADGTDLNAERGKGPHRKQEVGVVADSGRHIEGIGAQEIDRMHVNVPIEGGAGGVPPSGKPPEAEKEKGRRPQDIIIGQRFELGAHLNKHAIPGPDGKPVHGVKETHRWTLDDLNEKTPGEIEPQDVKVRRVYPVNQGIDGAGNNEEESAGRSVKVPGSGRSHRGARGQGESQSSDESEAATGGRRRRGHKGTQRQVNIEAAVSEAGSQGASAQRIGDRELAIQLNNQGVLLCGQTQYGEAREIFDAAVDIQVEGELASKIQNNRGFTCFKSGDLEAAYDSAKKSLEKDGRNAYAWNLLANCFVEQAKRSGDKKDYLQAHKCYENAMSLIDNQEGYNYIRENEGDPTKAARDEAILRSNYLNSCKRVNVNPAQGQPAQASAAGVQNVMAAEDDAQAPAASPAPSESVSSKGPAQSGTVGAQEVNPQTNAQAHTPAEKVAAPAAKDRPSSQAQSAEAAALDAEAAELRRQRLSEAHIGPMLAESDEKTSKGGTQPPAEAAKEKVSLEEVLDDVLVGWQTHSPGSKGQDVEDIEAGRRYISRGATGKQDAKPPATGSTINVSAADQDGIEPLGAPSGLKGKSDSKEAAKGGKKAAPADKKAAQAKPAAQDNDEDDAAAAAAPTPSSGAGKGATPKPAAAAQKQPAQKAKNTASRRKAQYSVRWLGKEKKRLDDAKAKVDNNPYSMLANIEYAEALDHRNKKDARKAEVHAKRAIDLLAQSLLDPKRKISAQDKAEVDRILTPGDRYTAGFAATVPTVIPGKKYTAETLSAAINGGNIDALQRLNALTMLIGTSDEKMVLSRAEMVYSNTVEMSGGDYYFFENRRDAAVKFALMASNVADSIKLDKNAPNLEGHLQTKYEAHKLALKQMDDKQVLHLEDNAKAAMSIGLKMADAAAGLFLGVPQEDAKMVAEMLVLNGKYGEARLMLGHPQMKAEGAIAYEEWKKTRMLVMDSNSAGKQFLNAYNSVEAELRKPGKLVANAGGATRLPAEIDYMGLVTPVTTMVGLANIKGPMTPDDVVLKSLAQDSAEKVGNGLALAGRFDDAIPLMRGAIHLGGDDQELLKQLQVNVIECHLAIGPIGRDRLDKVAAQVGATGARFSQALGRKADAAEVSRGILDNLARVPPEDIWELATLLNIRRQQLEAATPAERAMPRKAGAKAVDELATRQEMTLEANAIKLALGGLTQ
jgi:tetratricopeptide (TPR) repeat protein